MRTRTRLDILLAALAGLAIAGCSVTAGLGPTQPSGTTQQLLIRSLERALAGLDLSRFGTRTVDADVLVQAGNRGSSSQAIVTQGWMNQGFVNPSFVQIVQMWLKAHGVRTVRTTPDLKLKVFATVLGTDRGDDAHRHPGVSAPVINVPVPEIALFKWTRNRGQSELRLRPRRQERGLVEQLPVGTGHAKADDYTILLFIGFSVIDVDKPVP